MMIMQIINDYQIAGLILIEVLEILWYNVYSVFETQCLMFMLFSPGD